MAMSRANIWTGLKAAVNVLQKLEAWANTSTTGYIDLEGTLRAAANGDFAPESVDAIRSAVRSNLSNALSPSVVRRVLDPWLREFAATLDFPERDGNAILGRLYRNMVNNTETIKERNFTWGTPADPGTPSNTGTGNLHYLYTDADGNEIESQWAGAYRAECVADQWSGAKKHRETFAVRGPERYYDNLSLTGSGSAPAQMSAIDGAETLNLLRNPSFAGYTNSTKAAASTPVEPESTTAISNWTISSDKANFQLDVDTTYRQYDGESAATALRFEADDTITQNLSAAGGRFRADVPYFCQVAVYRESNATGTITLTLGGVTATLSLASLTNATWGVLFIGMNFGGTTINDAGEDCWFDNFNASSLALSIGVSSLAVGTFLVDDVLLAPMRQFDGGWFAPVGGATPFKAANQDGLNGDRFTWSNSISSDAVIQKWLHRGYSKYLPAASSPTVADP